MLDWKHDEPLVVGVVQPRALPGSPAWSDASIEHAIDSVVRDTEALVAVGIESVIVQNLWDGPTGHSASPTTIGAMSVLVRSVRAVCPGPLGVNLDANDGPATLAVAAAGGADFIRIKVLVGTMIKSGGLVAGCAAELAAARRLPGMPRIAVMADVHDRSGRPLGDVALEDDVEGALWSGADALIITGRSVPETVDMLDRVRPIVGSMPVVVGGGSKPDNVDQLLSRADGVIVGVYVKQDGIEEAPVDPERAARYLAAVRAVPRPPSPG